MRERFRKTILRELLILGFFVILSAGLVLQSRVINQRLADSPVVWLPGGSLEQNLAALGLAPNEINAVLMMEDFKKDFPRYAEADYRDAVGFYLSEFPTYPHRETLYQRIGAAQEKIDAAKAKLADARQQEELAQSLRRAGILLLALYPLIFGIRFFLRMKRAQIPKSR